MGPPLLKGDAGAELAAPHNAAPGVRQQGGVPAFYPVLEDARRGGNAVLCVCPVRQPAQFKAVATGRPRYNHTRHLPPATCHLPACARSVCTHARASRVWEPERMVLTRAAPRFPNVRPVVVLCKLIATPGLPKPKKGNEVRPPPPARPPNACPQRALSVYAPHSCTVRSRPEPHPPRMEHTRTPPRARGTLACRPTQAPIRALISPRALGNAGAFAKGLYDKFIDPESPKAVPFDDSICADLKRAVTKAKGGPLPP